MKHQDPMGWWLKWMFCAVLLLSSVFTAPKAALAHPLDVYLQATYITVLPTQIVVELDLTPGVLVAPEILTQLDPDGDQQITETEGQAYVSAVVGKVVLQVDGTPLALTVTKIELPPYLNIQAGYGTIRLFTTATPTASFSAGTHQLAYQNNYAPTGSAYQVNAFVDKDVAVTLGKQNRDSNQQRMTMAFDIGSAVVPITTASASSTLPVGTSAQTRTLLSYLYEPTRSPWVLLLALALAVALGGLHALTPGHGKTLVAAYLVGSRGTVRHAVTLGAIVTFTHTASVLLIGLLALFASQFVLPNVLLPILEMLSGLLVVFLGGHLLWQRWTVFRGSQHHGPDHDHGHDEQHDHHHNADHYAHGQQHTLTHDHGDGHVHTHLPPAEGIKLRNLLALGISGGLVPCPEALGIMVIAIGLNRILLGLGLIVSFSFGLAAVLIIIGILLVRSRTWVERGGGLDSRWSNALPLASALLVTVLGIGMTLSSVVSYLR